MYNLTTVDTPNDFGIYVDKLIRGLDKGKQLIVNEGRLLLVKPNNGIFYRITHMFSADKTIEVPHYLQKLDAVASSFFQSKLLDQKSKEDLYYKWSLFVNKLHLAKIDFVSSAIKSFGEGNESSSRLTTLQTIFDFYHDLGEYPYIGRYNDEKDWFYTFKTEYLTPEKQEILEKKVVNLLMQENERYRKNIPMTSDMHLCRCLLFAFLEAFAGKLTCGSTCYLDHTLNGYKNEPLLQPLLSVYYCTEERFSKDLIYYAFQVIDDAKGGRYEPCLSINNFFETIKNVRPHWRVESAGT